ncbi:hypothetical protein QBC38DRAFT_511535 [Podospora fimiseda]|uniref:Transporter n=1 Tax=Podospora fimiseda TaxID=252190 RepID=A0AAN7BK44_9PEZI|nr:hypothetical protein QBC38DRAFT_511535 [Podospora fimiseda]
MDNPDHGKNAQPARPPSLLKRLSQEFEDSRPPEGFVAATSDLASTFVAEHIKPKIHGTTPAIEEEDEQRVDAVKLLAGDPAAVKKSGAIDHTEPFENGYHFPPKYSTKDSTKQGLASFWKFFTTWKGFLWTIYGLNVVAWGGMLFLLLLNAAPAMCHPTCDDIDSPRRKWVEWDSQVLTGLFCVTAFGLAPWRFRDWWFLLKYRIMGDYDGLRRLAGIHRSWFRLKGSQELPLDVGPGNIPEHIPRSAVPIPEDAIPNAALTGTRAPPTSVWKLDFAIWSMVLNTFAQCGLCGVMWGMNRYDRPSWVTGFLVAIACIIAIVGGLVMFFEGKKVKSIEGVPCSDRDLEKLARDKELGIPHYNNIKDKKPKSKTQDPEKRERKREFEPSRCAVHPPPHLTYPPLCHHHHRVYAHSPINIQHPLPFTMATTIIPARAVIPFLVGMMLLTGVCNTLLTKYQDNQCVRNCDDPDLKKRKHFEQPVIQTLQMFVGEMGCWLVVGAMKLYERYVSSSSSYEPIPSSERHAADNASIHSSTALNGSSKSTSVLRGWRVTLLSLPAICDICGTTLMNAGLLLVAASIYQMTRGALVLFVGVFSVVFLKRKLHLFQWLSLVGVMAGVGIVGLAGAIQPDKKVVSAISEVDSDAIKVIIGVLMIAGAQIFTATQFVLEEWILERSEIEPIRVVGWEGLFGFLVTLLGMTVLHLLIGRTDEGRYGVFDMVEGWRQFWEYRAVFLSSILIMISIGGFNFFGLSVTRSVSATSRSTIDTCRTLFIWIVSLGLGWETFKWLQVVGFALLVYFTFLFNGIVQPPFEFLRVPEVEELLPEEPIEHN